jgi:hypothetical protein
MKEGYYFINVVDEDMNKIANFSEIVENKYNKDELTGLNFAQTKDSNFLLSLVFKSKEQQEETLETVKPFAFKRVYTEEENWIELMQLCEVCIIGSFTYKMLKQEKIATGSLTIDMPTYKRLKKAYEQALKENKKSFIFENTELLVDYAKYLLQYLENRLGVE